ncbi:MAG TPA: septum formation protein Maf [Firmicutes bacterium]|nr:septum formation protein Maf [Bacillota bacterium]
MPGRHDRLYRVVLASGSAGRQWTLGLLGLRFDVIPSGVDESRFGGLPPERLVRELSLAKAQAVVQSLGGDAPKSLVIGSDTIVVDGDTVLGKPGDCNEAEEMIERLSGRTHVVMSGVAVVLSDTLEFRVSHDVTKVKMRRLSREAIRRYVESGEPIGKAGGYAIQGRGALLVESIDGCYYNVVGLPLARLVDIVGELGLNIFDFCSL